MSSAALAWEQFRFERKMFWRNPSAAFFNFLLPLMLLVLTATAFGVDDEGLDILIPGVAGMGVLATTFTALAFNLTILRDDGVLKRIRGTPIPAGAYLTGLMGSVTLNAFLQVAMIVVVGNVAYGVDWPAEPALLVPVHRTRRGVLRGPRGRLLARDSKRGRGTRLHERGLPAADLHFRRLLLVRRPPRGSQDRGGGAAAQAPDRRPFRRDPRGHERRRGGGRGARGLGRGRAFPGSKVLSVGVNGSAIESSARFPGESEDYRAARRELLEAEVELRRSLESVAQARRGLPAGGRVPEDYVFEGTEGEVRMSELFAPRKDTLVLYSFMYGPEVERPCPACTSIVDGLDRMARHVDRRANLAVVARSPLPRILEFAQEHGWSGVRLLSSAANSYNRDYLGENEAGEQMPMLNVFARDGGEIRHFWGSELLYTPCDEGQEPRHVDLVWPLWHVIDATPEGRGDFNPSLSYE